MLNYQMNTQSVETCLGRSYPKNIIRNGQHHAIHSLHCLQCSNSNMYAYIYCVKNGGPFYKPVPKVEEWKITNIFYNSWKSISSPLIERPQTVDWQISLPLMVPRKSFCLCIFFATREEFQLYRSLRFDQISRKHFPL